MSCFVSLYRVALFYWLLVMVMNWLLNRSTWLQSSVEKLFSAAEHGRNTSSRCSYSGVDVRLVTCCTRTSSQQVSGRFAPLTFRSQEPGRFAFKTYRPLDVVFSVCLFSASIFSIVLRVYCLLRLSSFPSSLPSVCFCCRLQFLQGKTSQG